MSERERERQTERPCLPPGLSSGHRLRSSPLRGRPRAPEAEVLSRLAGPWGAVEVGSCSPRASVLRFRASANLMFPSFPAEGLILSRGVRRHGQNLFGQICAVIACLRLRAAGGLRADLRTFPPQLFCSQPPQLRGPPRPESEGSRGRTKCFASGRRRWGAGGKDFSARARLDPHEDSRCARKACVRRFWNQAVSLHHAAAQRHLKE